MLKALLSFLVAFPAISAAKDLTLERIFDSPAIDGGLPKNLSFSPDGKRLSFLQGKKENFEVQDLWEYDLATGKPKLLVDSKALRKVELSEEEKARRERKGQAGLQGIVEYKWSEDSQMILFPASNELFLYTLGKKAEQITKNSGAEVDVKFSDKSTYISYVRDQNLYIFEVKSKKEYAVTTQGKGDTSYATAEFVAQEEMNRMTGYWWSKDEQWLALTEIDESGVTTVERYEISADKVTSRKQKYPETGSPNAKIKLGVIRIADVIAGRTAITWLDLPKKDIYLTRADWTPDGTLTYHIQSRDQKELIVYSYDPVSRKTQTVLTEKDKYWVNLNDSWNWLKNSRLVFTSERSGYNHIYVMDAGKQPRAITKGKWVVDKINSVDEDGGWVYFSATLKSPLEKHFYRVNINKPAEPEALTTEEGVHDIEMAKDNKYYVREYSTFNTPPQVSLHKITGEKVADLKANKVVESHPLFPYKDGLITPEYGSFKGKSGHELYYSLVKPKNFDPNKKYPLVVMSYGGPIFQWVKKSWGGKHGLLAQYLAQHGFAVASFDNRGSSRRGRNFEASIYRAFGTVEVEDQVAGVNHLIDKGFVDKSRVGFYGWSYGGFLSLMLATKAPGVFRAHVAGAPVTDFALYDTHYTERYLGTPKGDAKVYQRANVFNFLDPLNTRLLVIHGMADDNVLFTNTTLLFKKLQEKGKVYESITYPGAKHGVAGKANQLHVYKSITDFFERYLK